MPSLVAAVLPGCLVLGFVVGCSDDDGASAPPSTGLAASVPTSAAAPTLATVTTVVVAAPPPATEAPTTAPPPPDPAALLAAAFDAAARGYHFVTNVTVNGAVAVTAEGDKVGDGSRLNVTSGGSTVAYAITPEGTWVFANESWSELDEPAPAGDPLGALRTPLSAVVTSFGNGPTVLTASYPAAALALTGDVPVEVVIEIDGTTLRSINYVSSMDGAPASVRADITPLVDTTPVTLPTV